MIKFLNRPLVALAAVLAVIFVIILIRSYATVDEVNDEENVQESEATSYFYGPQLPSPFDQYPSRPFINTPITLGTFEALNGTCFLKNGGSFVFQEPDDFTDLQDGIDGVHQRHHYNVDADDDFKALDTLGDLLHLLDSDDDDDDDDDEKENSYSKFTSEISRYQMYSPNSDTVDELLYDMQTQAIFQIGEVDKETQFKLRAGYDNGVVALLKPKRTSRDEQALPNQIYFAEFERHTSEIAAYHLDRVLGFYRAPPTIGRNIDMIVELMRIAEPRFQRTFYISPKPDENLCFTGTCGIFCDSYHPICGNGTIIEASLSAYLPENKGAERQIRSHPWEKSKNEKENVEWESNPDYCNEVKMQSEFSEGRLLPELIDLSIFDFLTGNMDRYNYQQFKAFLNDTFVLSCDHGRAFGRAFHDDLKILAPMLQCCMIRSSTLQTLLNIHNSDTPLSKRMNESMSIDPIAPILWEPHLKALDRRLVIVLQAVRDCISRYSIDDVIIADDDEDFK